MINTCFSFFGINKYDMNKQIDKSLHRFDLLVDLLDLVLEAKEACDLVLKQMPENTKAAVRFGELRLVRTYLYNLVQYKLVNRNSITMCHNNIL